jgi:hypothetical protein
LSKVTIKWLCLESVPRHKKEKRKRVHAWDGHGTRQLVRTEHPHGYISIELPLYMNY